MSTPNKEVYQHTILMCADNNRYHIFEMLSLLKTAGYRNLEVYSQKIDQINKAYYVGSGKLELIKEELLHKYGEAYHSFLFVLDVDLSGTQKTNIEDLLEMEVLDRTDLILEIFEHNANTAESKLQVEIAKLNYLSAQLVDSGANYAQVTSGRGKNKGAGETEKELSRRQIQNTIHRREKELEEIKKSRRTARKKRQNSGIPIVSVVGYTNAGKSTLVNKLINYSNKKPEKELYAADELFATLETSSRLIDIWNYPSFILSDTVGFISNLPHSLVAAFRSTLEEISEADYLIQVVDVSNPQYKEQMETTMEVLKELNAESIPMMTIYNKYDKLTFNPLITKENEIITSILDDNETPHIFNFILSQITSSWDEYTIKLPLDFDFRVMAKENFIVKKINKKDGYLCTIRFNPLYKYKYKAYFLS